MFKVTKRTRNQKVIKEIRVNILGNQLGADLTYAFVIDAVSKQWHDNDIFKNKYMKDRYNETQYINVF